MQLRKKRKIRALHIASFRGNIGDYANHQGFYKKMNKYMTLECTQVEIRKFYRNRAEIKFDDSFVGLVNKHDVFILGGGGFFDLNWDYSNTGTTMDFSNDFINAIKVPVLINAMGYHEYDNVDEKKTRKFKNFISAISEKSWFLSVRNDGSFLRMKKRYGALADNFLKVPDNGFFFSPSARGISKILRESLMLKKTSPRRGICLERNKIWVGFNLTNDLFNKDFNKDISVEDFNFLIGGALNVFLRENMNANLILFPHVPQDIATISRVFRNVEDKYKRERIAVAPFLIGGQGIEQVFDLYRMCKAIVGMRFHANVCAIAMGVPTIGLAGHEQISTFYNEIGLSQRSIKINSNNFVRSLLDELTKTLQNPDRIKEQYNKINLKLGKEGDNYYKKVSDWLNNYEIA